MNICIYSIFLFINIKLLYNTKYLKIRLNISICNEKQIIMSIYFRKKFLIVFNFVFIFFEIVEILKIWIEKLIFKLNLNCFCDIYI